MEIFPLQLRKYFISEPGNNGRKSVKKKIIYYFSTRVLGSASDLDKTAQFLE